MKNVAQSSGCKADEGRGEGAYKPVRDRAEDEDNAADGVFGRASWDKFGFTTGMAAAAATAAAADLIRSGIGSEIVTLRTPDGKRRLDIAVAQLMRTGDGALARVVKDAGPDRDVTDGIVIEARVMPRPIGTVLVEGGSGVGKVTRPGLGLAVGLPAINPVPLAHIKAVAAQRCEEGAVVRISAFGGSAIAARTFNPRLGIEGGISILGTSGLVRPMSLEAWKAALLPQIDQAAALGHDEIVLTFGNLGRLAALKLGWSETAIIQMGNFAGFMLRRAAAKGLGITIVGHLGKIVKLAAGYENTHHRKTPDRLLLLSEFAKSVDPALAAQVASLPSAEAASGFLLESAPGVLPTVANAAKDSVSTWIGNRTLRIAITNLAGQVVAWSQ